MPPTVWQLLEGLPAHFGGVAPTDAAVERAFMAAHKLKILARNHA